MKEKKFRKNSKLTSIIKFQNDTSSHTRIEAQDLQKKEQNVSKTLLTFLKKRCASFKMI